MAIWNRDKHAPDDGAGIVGTVRLARRDSDIAALKDGEIAVVEHPELDGRQAQALIDRRVRAVINAAPSSSGRIPNIGPQMLLQSGVALIDVTGEDIWSRLKNGDRLRIEEGRILRDEVLVASGVQLDESRTTSDLADAEQGLATKLDSLVANATDHIHREQAMLIGGAKVPHLRTPLRGRAVIVVSRAYDDAADLRGLRRYIADHEPVLVGAGPGADVILTAGHTPDLVVGAIDHLSDRAIKAAGEVVVTTASGTFDMPERLERHGKEIVTFVSTGSDDDLAILLADTNDAAVIVHVGAPPTLSEFLERAPSDVARMFVARLRAGSKIVDAKSVHHFIAPRASMLPFILLLILAAAAVAGAVAATPVGQDWFDSLGDQLTDLGSWIKGLFT